MSKRDESDQAWVCPTCRDRECGGRTQLKSSDGASGTPLGPPPSASSSRAPSDDSHPSPLDLIERRIAKDTAIRTLLSFARDVERAVGVPLVWLGEVERALDGDS
jgi:hypothetical protein